MLTVASCTASIEHTRLNWAARPLPSRPLESVELFTSGPPARPHMDLVVYQVSSAYESMAQLLSRLRVEAAREGCDALVAHVGREIDEATEVGVVTATCIVYTDGGAGPEAAEVAQAPEVAQAQAQAQTAAAPVIEVEGTACEPVAGMKNAYRCNGTLVCREGRCVHAQ